MKLGKFRLKVMSDGTMGADGGAMFGVVPKVMWERLIPADEKNRITLGMNSLFVDTGEHKIIIDTGSGNKESSRFREIYKLEQGDGLSASLAKANLQPTDIDIVINTHLHFDHCGGNTVISASGETVPAFPNAGYFIRKGEWDEATGEDVRNKASYFGKNLIPVEKTGQLELISEDCQIVPGVRVFLTPGHTRDHQSVLIESEGETACFVGDLIPTSHHLRLPYVMAYDIEPMRTLDAKRKLYETAIADKWLLFFVHGTNIIAAHIEGSPDKPVLSTRMESKHEDFYTPDPYGTSS